MDELRTLSVKSAQQSERVIRFIASDESLDRDGDIITATGWQLGNYLKNPVVLYGHDYDKLPVGKAVSVHIDTAARQLIIDVQFPTVEELSSGVPSEHALFVDSVYNLAKLGVLNAVSVGFRGLQVEPILDEKGQWVGRRFLSQELMELSIVPVPANANAVAIMREAKVDAAVIKSFQSVVAKVGRRLSAASLASLHAIRDKLDEANAKLDEALAEYAALVGDIDQQDDGQDEPKATEPDAKNVSDTIEIIDTHIFEFDEPKNGESKHKE